MAVKKSLLPKLLDFIRFTHKFQQIKRVILATGEDRDENDAEHSFQLAMICWYLAASRKMKLNIDKVIEYALVHDLVEVYAGDTYFYTKDESLRASKAKREKDAAERISQEFSEFKSLSQLINAYEKQTDREAKFVYAMDKILPAINVLLDDGKSWRRDNVNYEMVRAKDAKVAVSKEAVVIWQEYIEVLDKNKHLLPLS